MTQLDLLNRSSRLRRSNYVNRRIRVNRYAKSYTGVNIQDTIPDGQVLAPSGNHWLLLPDWENGYGRTKLDKAHVQVTDKNHFAITPNGDGTLDHKGLFILYRTRLTKPVDQVTKRVLNNVSVTTKEEAQPIDFGRFCTNYHNRRDWWRRQIG